MNSKRAHHPTPPPVEISQTDRLRVALNERCTRIAKLIKSRFNATELTATRYRLLIDEVRLGILSNLHRQNDLKTSVAHLHRSTLEAALADPDSSTNANIQAQRLDMLTHVDTRIAELEIANEQALHVLDRAIVTLASAQPLHGAPGAGLERSVSDLEYMLGQAHRQGAGDLEDEFDIKPAAKKTKDKLIITPGSS